MGLKRIPGNVFGRSLLIYGLSVGMLSSCAVATAPVLQPEVNSLLVANRVDMAADKIAAKESDYGHGNYLLYYLDRGLVSYYAGRYKDSIFSFEKAKQRFDELYTRSLSKEAASWVVNDYTLPYRGSDYEYILINIFQALNFLALGEPNEALVEARDMDAKYQVVDDRQSKVEQKRFADNGFGRLFMSLVYQAAGGRQNLNDALIESRKALALYRTYYGGKYVPLLLKQDLLALGEYFYDPAYSAWRGEFGNIRYLTMEERARKAEVVVIQLVGYSPLKVPQIIPVPLEKGFIAKITFPKFAKRYYDIRSGRLVVEGGAVGGAAEAELGADIEEIAIKDLEAQKAFILSKSVLRPALKYLVARKQKENIEKKNGRLAAEVFGLFSNLYNIFSEQADLRSWQALPAQIRIVRYFLDPGTYRLHWDEIGADGNAVSTSVLAEGSFRAGERRFFVTRTTR